MPQNELLGIIVPVTAVDIVRARDLADRLADARIDFARLVECRKLENGESIVFDVDVEVPTARRFDIRPVERIAAFFTREDATYPDTFALREDFPLVPHLNLRCEKYPKSLCLFDEPWPALRLRWTSATYVERIRSWLALTARGELHGDDQPLEPILLSWAHRIVLPSNLFSSGDDNLLERLLVTAVNGEKGRDRAVLIAHRLSHAPLPTEALRFVATVFRCEPREHGVISHAPVTLDDLNSLATTAGFDLLGELQKRLRSWYAHKDIHPVPLILIIWFPKIRTPGGAPEASDVWAFALNKTIEELGTLLGVWQRDGNGIGLVVGEPTPLQSANPVPLSVLSPLSGLTRNEAAVYNGLSGSDDRPFVAIGCGALGSQVLLNLSRSGFGRWTLVDDDRIFPHNLSRHALDGFAIGRHKATVLAHTMNSLIDEVEHANPLVCDVLSPEQGGDRLNEVMREAAVVFDFSASLPVARALATSMAPETRKVSVFLSPSGNDLVILAEDRERKSTLDILEHQLYRAIIQNKAIKGHLQHGDNRIRYAQSCRDVSSRMPQDLTALHAAIASRAVRQVADSDDASITIWRAGDTLAVARIEIATSAARIIKSNGWTLCTDEEFIAHVSSLRSQSLPNETGGVLLGSFDLERRIVYVFDTIPSPSDSEQWPTLYIRGAKGLEARVKEVGEQTKGMLQYIGEWHSHPDGCPCLPSEGDCTVFDWLTTLMDKDGLPPVVLIVGEGGETAFFVAQIIQGRVPE